ncbi:MAG: fumarylacetoacetate hydrolase family protein [Bacteroidales bacterium]|nr:fumarylacetoacetate hydrolase family protein [Bacteroidales bacterium]MDZ4203274.1 fumarylacetoacetate hydrolase family protein [Bacteroidales bacterium]
MKIICIGRNYIEHAKELKNPVPTEPVFFLKPDTALQIKNRPFFYPDFSSDIHYELEVVLKLNKTGKNIDLQFANDYFDQVGLGVDFTARDLQQRLKDKGLPWEKSKAFDYSAPVSEFIPRNELGDLSDLHFRLNLNGKSVQNGSTADMIFSFADIISYVSRFITLRAGDLIFTGTPEGVGPVKIGDHLQAWIGDRKMLDFRVK